MNIYRVTFDVWRESLTGRFYRDGTEEFFVEASTEEVAIKRENKKKFGLPRGQVRSQRFWGEKYKAEKLEIVKK